jgi:hypothetical protein
MLRSPLFIVSAVFGTWLASPCAAQQPKLLRSLDDTQVELSDGAIRQLVRRGDRFGTWTVMDVAHESAVLEDFTRRDGHVLFVNARGVQLDLPKTLEPTTVDPKTLYLGHTLAEVSGSANDLLGKQLLDRPGDPDYTEVARVFPPIKNVKWDTHNFVATPDTFDKVAFRYTGRTPNFDPAVYAPAIEAARKRGDVWQGLVGGDLPVMRYVYPDAGGAWTELLAFAPFRVVNDNHRVQPVWYRVSRIEHGQLVWTHHIDSYLTPSSHASEDTSAFYRDLQQLRQRWDALLQEAMKVQLPDSRLQNMARLSLMRAIMTRVGDFPKYGVADRDYAGSEHDGFPDTFTVETTAMLDWGLIERAGAYIDNYFGSFVRDDGSILYRGPETGQFGRMLTVVAQYANLGGKIDLLLKHRKRIDAIATALLALRERALTRPASDPAYGMIAGWSEADSCLEPDPSRYVQPYFSNSTEAARGFRDLGRVWSRIGRARGDAKLTAWGERLVHEAEALRADLSRALERSQLRVGGGTMIPAIAGAKEPFDVAVKRDLLDPQFRAYRAYNEMMYSGSLTPAQVRGIVDYRSHHHDVILGVPTAYNKAELAGFLAYGYGYGLIESDFVREALLLLYADMAHQYTRGAWLAPETRRPLTDEEAAPYCSPAQLVVPMLARWLLVFEDPESGTLWLGRAIPRAWLADGKVTGVSGAPTSYGRIDFAITSQVSAGSISAQIELPRAGIRAPIKLRLRAPTPAQMKSVTLNDKAWTQFDPAAEVVMIPPRTGGTLRVVAHY